jgi:hypothetical protein
MNNQTRALELTKLSYAVGTVAFCAEKYTLIILPAQLFSALNIREQKLRKVTVTSDRKASNHWLEIPTRSALRPQIFRSLTLRCEALKLLSEIHSSQSR